MTKDKFRRALRRMLERAPLDARKKWTANDLYLWWLEERREDPYLIWKPTRGDVWQYVPGMCQDLIGANAVW
jgi:hypothetical protein